jgi:hypothetical protein
MRAGAAWRRPKQAVRWTTSAPAVVYVSALTAAISALM